MPTFAELGYPKLTALTWFSLSGPAGLPKSIVTKLNFEVRNGLRSQSIREQLAFEYIETEDWDADTFTQFFKSEIELWSPMVRSVLQVK